MYELWKIGKHTFQSSSADRRGQWCQGIVWHKGTRCDHGTGTILVPGRTGIHPRDWGAEPRDEHQSCCCPRTHLQRGVCPRKWKRFFIPHLFLAVPTNLCLSSSRAEPVASRQQQENPSKQWFARLGDRFIFILSSVIRKIHSPQQDLLLNKGPFSTRSCRLPLAPNSSFSDTPLVLFKAIVVQESGFLYITKSWDKEKPLTRLTLPTGAPMNHRNHVCIWKLLFRLCQEGKSHKPRRTRLLRSLSTVTAPWCTIPQVPLEMPELRNRRLHCLSKSTPINY